MESKIYLSDWRDAANLNQEDVADAVGKSTPSISKWETGKRVPGLDDLDRLAKLYGCTIKDLFVHPATAKNEKLAQEVEAILNAMTPEARDAWLGLGKHLVSQALPPKADVIALERRMA